MNSEIKNLSDRTRLTDNTDNNKCLFDGCRKKLGTQVHMRSHVISSKI